MKSRAIIITGPTASGKSDFAHQLALRINGAIINCDSVQIYRGIESISASPFDGRDNFNEIDGVPYKLFSILPLDEHISVTDYLALARDAMNAVVGLGKTPIFVGGTGYYINVLLNGISPMPDISDESRRRAREMVQHDLNAAKQLLSSDSKLNDPQRIARALEVLFETGKQIEYWQNMPRRDALVPDVYKILILPERDVLQKRIAARIPKMMNSGALREAQNIIANNQNPERAIGAVQLCKMLRGEMSESDAISNWITKTNQYAKRQRTWFRGQYAADLEIPHVPTLSDVERVAKNI